jgi:copper resistance protein C
MPTAIKRLFEQGTPGLRARLITSHTLAAAVIAAVFVLSSPWLGGGTAYAHAHLTRSEPRDGSTVIPAPNQVALWFTESLEPAFSGVEVRDAQGGRVDQGEPQISGATMHVGLKALPPGTYKVNWHALSIDTHKTNGSFSFQVGK